MTGLSVDETNRLSNADRQRAYKDFWEPKLPEISYLYNQMKFSHKVIAKHFGVHPSAISKVMNRYRIADREPIIGSEEAKRGQYPNICECCGKEFFTHYSRKRKYCSVDCWQKIHTDNKKETRICKTCGKVFELYTFEIEKDGKGVHCSKACFQADMKSRNVITYCQFCGAEIKTIQSRVRDNRGKFCSRNCAAMWRVMNNTFDYATAQRSKSGRREDLDNRYFRSSWEANYARYLNWLIEHDEIAGWEYEVETFEFPVNRGNVRYLPDFKITNNDGSVEYHEVKGYMDKNSAVKLKRMAKYYPDVKLILIDKPVYESIKKQMQKMIPNWE